MDPITALSIGGAVVKGVGGIFGANAAHNDAVRQTRARNQAMMNEYKHRLRIRDKQAKDIQQNYAVKLGQYDRQMSAADRAASRAFGIEQYNQSQRLKQAAFQGMRLSRAFAAKQGSAAAAGKTGRSARRLDANIESSFVRNQNMIAQNLLTAEETRQYREMGIRDKFDGIRNQAYSRVEIAPTNPLPLLEPTQLSGPSTAGRNMAMLNAGLGMATSIAGAFAPNPGDMGGGGGGTGFGVDTAGSYGSNWNEMSNYVSNSPFSFGG